MSLLALQPTTIKYESTFPCSKKKFEYRPFLVKEEKILLIASEKGASENDMKAALYTVLSACTFEKFDIKKLSITDFTWLILQLKIKSSTDITQVSVACRNEECKAKADIEINLNDIAPDYPEGHESKFLICEQQGIGVSMVAPAFDSENVNDPSKILELLYETIEFVYTEDTIIYMKDTTFEEFEKWAGNLDREHFVKINKFFETLPKIKYEIKNTCKKCRTENTYTIEDVKSFFFS